MPSWLSWLPDVFKDSDGHWNWPWIGTVLAAAGTAIATVVGGAWAVFIFFAERNKAGEKKGGDANTFNFGSGFAMGGNAKFRGKLSFGLDETKAQKNFDEIKSLVKQLIANQPTPSPPGEEKRIGEAVQSIAQGAAEGDSRLQQAFDFLTANKIAEATQLLRAFAEDKTASAEQATARAAKDRKEAALAYRNLGAIAGLADPKRALEAYEKAIALDPDDLGSLLWAGWIQIDYGDLNKARARLERVLTLAKTSGLAFYRYGAFIGLGDIKKRRGDLAGALDSYRDTLAIAERLAKSDPSDANWQRDLSVAFNKIGDVQKEQGDHAGALKSYNDSLAIFEQLAKADPGNAKWQRDLSVSYDRVGNVQFVKGEFAGALKSFRDGLAIAERQAIADPGNAGRQRDLSLYYQRVGDVQLVWRDFAAVLKSYRNSLAIVDRLAKSDPDNAGWQRDLSVAFNKIGDVQKEQGDHAGALKSYNDGLAIINRLAKSDLRDAVWQRDLFVSYTKVSDVQETQGEFAVALKSYNDGLAIINRLAQSDPENAEWQQDLAASFFKIAKVHVQFGDNAKALEFLLQAQAIVSRLTKISPDNAMWKQELALFDLLIKGWPKGRNTLERHRGTLSPHPGRARMAERRPFIPVPRLPPDEQAVKVAYIFG